MWKIFFNNLWNVFSTILVIAIILAVIVGGVHLMYIGGPIVIFTFLFLFVIVTCYIDARRKYQKKLIKEKCKRITFIESCYDALLREFDGFGYSEYSKELIDKINVEICNYENIYGEDDTIKNIKARLNTALEHFVK